jgi:hypothetical protein
MSQAVKEKSIYSDAFREFTAREAEGRPAWVARLREGAFARFEELGFPTTDEEDWKYTNVASIARPEARRNLRAGLSKISSRRKRVVAASSSWTEFSAESFRRSKR